MIKSITIKGYKSIKCLENFSLTNLNILIGTNGAGKSNFISAFKLLNILLNKQLQYVTQSKGPDSFLFFGRKNTQKIYLNYEFKRNSYDVTLEPTLENRLLITKEQIYFKGDLKDISVVIGENIFESNLKDSIELVKYKKVSQYVLDNIANLKLYHFNDVSDTARVKGLCSRDDNLILKEDAQNLAAYLLKLKVAHKRHYDQIIRTVRQIAPYFGGFIFRESENIQLEWFDISDPDTPFKAHVLSDGTLRFICLATLLLQPLHLMPQTIIIDEPELGLHPNTIILLSDIIKRASESKQIIISTQSTEFLNCFDVDNIIVVDREDRHSLFNRLDEQKLSAWLEDYSIGELWKSNLIGGKP